MMEYIKSLKWVDYFLFTLVDPRRLQNQITREEGYPTVTSLIIVFFASIIEIVTFALLGTESEFFYYKLTYGWLLFFIIFITMIIITGSLIDLFCQFRGYPGNIKQILNLISISLFTRALLLPMTMIFKVFNFAPIFFYILFSIALSIWHIMIIIQGISEMHQVSFSESLLIFFLPIVLVGAILFFSTILIVINIVGLISIF